MSEPTEFETMLYEGRQKAPETPVMAAAVGSATLNHPDLGDLPVVVLHVVTIPQGTTQAVELPLYMDPDLASNLINEFAVAVHEAQTAQTAETQEDQQ